MMIWCALVKLIAIVRRWQLRRATIRQLLRLNDHLLKDIGISRSEVEVVADQLAKSIPDSNSRAQQDSRFPSVGWTRPAPARKSKLQAVARTERRDRQGSKSCTSPAGSSSPTAT
jgi:uncharacterized protein YjiS (DUF1127 family)